MIAFTHAAEIGAETETTTVIKGYNGDDTKEIELKSGKLTCSSFAVELKCRYIKDL